MVERPELLRTFEASSDGHTPTRSSSFHSKMTMLTRGSWSPSGVVLTNTASINGSVSPPHAVLLYMPLHCRRFCSFCVCSNFSPFSSPQKGFARTIFTSSARTRGVKSVSPSRATSHVFIFEGTKIDESELRMSQSQCRAHKVNIPRGQGCVVKSRAVA